MGRAVYIPINDKIWFDYYNEQAKQTGHGIQGYQGIPYQRGNGLGSFFGRLFRSILPVAKRVGKSALKAIGQEALNMGSNVATDLSEGQGFKQSLKKQGLKAGQNLINRTDASIKNQTGGRIGKRQVASKVKTVAKKSRLQKKKGSKKCDIFYNQPEYGENN